jgi:hypothetical protein
VSDTPPIHVRDRANARNCDPPMTGAREPPTTSATATFCTTAAIANNRAANSAIPAANPTAIAAPPSLPTPCTVVGKRA